MDVQVFLQTGPSSYGLLGSETLTVTDTPRASRSSALNRVDLASAPASFTITGNGFVNLGFGLPWGNFTRGGLLLTQAQRNGPRRLSTSLTGPFPNDGYASAPGLTGLSAGPVEVQVFLQTGPNSYSLLGSGHPLPSSTPEGPSHAHRDQRSASGHALLRPPEFVM